MTTIPDIKDWHEEEITRVRISMAPPLRWVNSYLLHGPKGITIIDPGPRTETAEAEWKEVWSELGILPQDITSIVLTHHHPDHYGLAGYMQSLTGASVTMSRRAHEESLRMWGKDSVMREELPRLFRRHGMPAMWSDQIAEHLDGFIPQVTPSPNITYITEGSYVCMGGRNWLAIETAGHAPGHISFYDIERGIILCGDSVLPQISPNVSLLPGSDPQPLRSFIDSLVKLGELDVKLAFPGHRNPFSHFAERTNGLIKHHEERLLRIEALLQQSSQSGFDICTALFGNDLGIHQMRFAMSEALAHLVHLVGQGRVVEKLPTTADGVILFSSIN